jgi:serine/threonine protein phosphatase PrpC
MGSRMPNRRLFRVLGQTRSMKTAADQRVLHGPKCRIDASIATDTGCQRDHNEDHIEFFAADDPAVRSSKGALAVVADGMGGHLAGGLASELAVQVARRTYYQEPGEGRKVLQTALERANREIYDLSLTDEAYHGMGTTCTALVLTESLAHCAHVGDSRLYLIRDGQIRLMTEDHSLVREMVKAGILTPEQARTHPNRNVISRALGVRPSVDLFVWQDPVELRDGDTFVLCSDGLHDPVREDEIRGACVAESPEAACRSLVDLAKQRGGHDNISVGVFRVRAED